MQAVLREVHYLVHVIRPSPGSQADSPAYDVLWTSDALNTWREAVAVGTAVESLLPSMVWAEDGAQVVIDRHIADEVLSAMGYMNYDELLSAYMNAYS